jgi:plasmid stabilization system protein ParE
MTRPLVFSPAAQAEATDALEWYDLRSPAPGDGFEEELDNTIARIAENPQLFRVLYKGVRRALLQRFPYGLFFRILPDGIQVIACLHTKRSPRHWRRRV